MSHAVSSATFNDLSIPSRILSGLESLEFKSPTPIQEQTIPHALNGFDILGSAQTGTGKTAAFCIPLLAHILDNPSATALILTPTRELAQQIYAFLGQLVSRHWGIRGVLLIGGDSIQRQIFDLRKKPRIIVGTPGRVCDHLDRRTLDLRATDFLVLDEMDRMLDIGFEEAIRRIIPCLSASRQTLLFSATMSPMIVKLAGAYLKEDAVRISVGSSSQPTDNVEQIIMRTTESEKYALLLDKIHDSTGTFIIFVKTKFGTDRLALNLQKEGLNAEAIHGDLRQRQREQVIRRFRQGDLRILVATDVAARGLDVPGIEYVINYDLPQSPADYIHRIGRTGRAGTKGKALSFLTAQDNAKWRAICRLIDPKSEEKQSKMGSKKRAGGKYSQSYKDRPMRGRAPYKGGPAKSGDGAHAKSSRKRREYVAA